MADIVTSQAIHELLQSQSEAEIRIRSGQLAGKIGPAVTVTGITSEWYPWIDAGLTLRYDGTSNGMPEYYFEDDEGEASLRLESDEPGEYYWKLRIRGELDLIWRSQALTFEQVSMPGSGLTWSLDQGEGAGSPEVDAPLSFQTKAEPVVSVGGALTRPELAGSYLHGVNEEGVDAISLEGLPWVTPYFDTLIVNLGEGGESYEFYRDSRVNGKFAYYGDHNSSDTITWNAGGYWELLMSDVVVAKSFFDTAYPVEDWFSATGVSVSFKGNLSQFEVESLEDNVITYGYNSLRIGEHKTFQGDPGSIWNQRAIFFKSYTNGGTSSTAVLWDGEELINSRPVWRGGGKVVYYNNSDWVIEESSVVVARLWSGYDAPVAGPWSWTSEVAGTVYTTRADYRYEEAADGSMLVYGYNPGADRYGYWSRELTEHFKSLFDSINLKQAYIALESGPSDGSTSSVSEGTQLDLDWEDLTTRYVKLVSNENVLVNLPTNEGNCKDGASIKLRFAAQVSAIDVTFSPDYLVPANNDFGLITPREIPLEAGESALVEIERVEAGAWIIKSVLVFTIPE